MTSKPDSEETERVPAEVWPLAYFLAEEMAARGWDDVDVAQRMGPDRDLRVDILTVGFVLAVQDDNVTIDDHTFEGLARAFDVSEQCFRRLDDGWRRHPDRRAPFDAPDSLFRFHLVPPEGP